MALQMCLCGVESARLHVLGVVFFKALPSAGMDGCQDQRKQTFIAWRTDEDKIDRLI